jgi:hypothetical protein
VVEDVLVAALLIAGVRPPVVEGLAGGRNHSGDEDKQIGGPPRAYERRGEAAERVTDNDQVLAISDGIDDRVRVVPPA